MAFDKETLLFHQLILSFHTAAWQQLGKVANPFSGKIEKDIESASMSIDMLDMIKSKMAGNLSEEEQNFLDRTLGDLKLNYMDELSKQEKEQEKEAESGESGEAEGSESEDSDETSPKDESGDK